MRTRSRPVLALLAAFALAALGLLATVPAAAAPQDAPEVEVRADRPRPSADMPVHITYTFSGTGSLGDIKPPPTFPVKNLSLTGGPSTSTQIVFLNGDLKKSVSLIYRFRPNGPGQAEIGETTWNVAGKSVTAPAYLLEVGPPRPGQTAGASPDDEDPIIGRFPGLSPRGLRRAPAQSQRETLLLYVVTPERSTAYVGEEVVLHYELVTQADVSGFEWVEPPKFPGFWAEDLDKPEHPTGRRDTLEGRPVLRFTILKKAISGLSAGTLTVPPSSARIGVRVQNDPFDDPFSFMRPQVVERSTQALAIKVLPIPGNAEFKGPVGRFELSSSLDRRQVASGEAATLKVKLSGTGSLRTTVEPPRLSIAGARVYPPTSKTSSGRTGGRPTSSAEWTYVVVPTSPGELTIPPVAIEIFDPAEKRIVTRATSPLKLSVEGGTAQASSVPQSTPQAIGTGATPPPAPTETGTSAVLSLPVTEETAGSRTGSGSGRAPGAATPRGPALDLTRRTVTVPLWLLAAVPAALLLAAGTVLVFRKRDRLQGDLKKALVPEAEETKERAANRIDRALRTALAKRWGVPEASSSGAFVESLSEAGAPTELVADVKELLSELDFLRFAPQLGEYGDRLREAREKARELFGKL